PSGEVLGGGVAAARQLRPDLPRPARATADASGLVKLYPAVDILGGKAVRLVKGDFQAKTVYEEDPLAAARRWTEEGADYLHVVDLDGARTGVPVNLEQLQRIAAALGVQVQYGGGLRSLESIEAALSAGAARVILGTAAFTIPDLLEEALRTH